MSENSINKKIAFVLPSLEYGGAEIQTLQQIKALSQEEYFISLIILSKSINKELIEINDLKNTEILVGPLPSIGYDVKSILLFFLNLNKYYNLFAQSFDLVIANLPISHFVSRIIKLIRGLCFFKVYNLIIYHRSLQFAESPLNSFPKKLFNFFHSSIAFLTDTATICISKAVYTNIYPNFFLRKPTILFNAISKRKINESWASEYINKLYERSQSIPLWVIPGRINEAKGQMFFLSVLSNFIKANNIYPNQLKVIIAGGGDSQEKVEKILSELQLSEFVYITGYLQNDNLLSLVKRANWVIIPSINEGFGNVAIEALMCGSQILASDSGGLKEIVIDGKTGFIFSAANPIQLEAKLKMIYSFNRNQIFLPNNLMNYFDSLFLLDIHINRLKKIIKECVE